MEDVSKYPALTAELLKPRLLRRGRARRSSAEHPARVMRQAEAVAKKLQAERGPSLAKIEDLDGVTPATKSTAAVGHEVMPRVRRIK